MNVLGMLLMVVLTFAMTGADSGGFRSMSIAPGEQMIKDHGKLVAPPSAKRKREACDVKPSAASEADKTRYLESHNRFRGTVQGTAMLKMEWDDNLAQRAQAWADKCIWKHDYLTDCSGARLGQNLYMIGGGTSFPANNASRPVQSWYDEVKFYDYPGNKCAGGVCGHFTQVVWERSRKLGCGWKNCPTLTIEGKEPWTNVLYTVCDYSPAGNYENQRAYVKGEPCSKCTSSQHGVKCENNECAPCNPSKEAGCECKNDCSGNGVNDPNTCACQCKDSFSGEHCEKNCADCKNADGYDDTCASWAAYCTDDSYKSFMTVHCSQTCKYCTPCA